ncbi:MAG: hypothetical protein ACREP7_01360 [Lysobacter sp.]
MRRLINTVLSIAVLAAAIHSARAAEPAETSFGFADSQRIDAARFGGRWMAGDLHAHTIQSDDAQTPLDNVLEDGLFKFGLDWIALSDHLRVSHRDSAGAPVPASAGIPMSQGIGDYQIPRVRQLQADRSYARKLIYQAAEWDIPTHDHGNIGIFSGWPLASDAKALNRFEYLFTNRPVSMFAPDDVRRWDAADTRAYSTHADALAAIAWLKKHYPRTSYAFLNHPSRNPGKYSAAQFREFNDAAPNIVFAIEGMVGNQMEPDRGGYNSAYVPANAKSRTYGGVDYVVAQVGGIWDALLGEGRRIWNVADSDHHFKISKDRQYSSGYFPGEYAKTYVWMTGTGVAPLLDGLRSGRVFAAYGDLIDALEFSASNGLTKAEMGGELKALPGGKVRLTIRFKSPRRNNMEYLAGSGVLANTRPVVDHIDLIAGDVGPKAQPGTPSYDKDSNDSTRVIARFTAADWVRDRDGYNVVTFDVAARKNQYFRLRGTNLGVNVDGETRNGNPLPDARTDIADPTARFNAINARNYKDLWFYSNPIFVSPLKLAPPCNDRRPGSAHSWKPCRPGHDAG